ncbi:MAG: nucleotidyltransferase domain-containing protein [Alkaliphilus sp.]
MSSATTLDNKAISILNNLKKRLFSIKNLNVEKIVVYGSYARGEFHKESDFDVLIFTDTISRVVEDSITDIMVDLSLEYDLVVSLQLQETNEFYNYLDVLPFFQNVENEGVLFYEH